MARRSKQNGDAERQTALLIAVEIQSRNRPGIRLEAAVCSNAGSNGLVFVLGLETRLVPHRELERPLKIHRRSRILAPNSFASWNCSFEFRIRFKRVRTVFCDIKQESFFREGKLTISSLRTEMRLRSNESWCHETRDYSMIGDERRRQRSVVDRRG